MSRSGPLAVLILALIAALAGCAPKPVEVDLQVAVRLEGKPVKGVAVTVDGVTEGATDEQGVFAKSVSRQPGKVVRVTATPAADARLRVKDGASEFTVKARGDSEPRQKEALNVVLQRYVTVAALYEGKPVDGAKVAVDGRDAGATQQNGELEVGVDSWPKAGVRLAVKKDGFGESRLVYRGKPGERVEVALYKDAVISVEVLEDRYGSHRPIKGATVYLGSKQIGATAADGTLKYRYKGALGDKATLRIAAAGYVPDSATRSVKLGGPQKLRQYFQPAEARPLRTAVLAFVGNTSGEDIGDAVKKIEAAFLKELFDAKAFSQVPTATAMNLIKRSKLGVEKLKTAGWRGTPLADEVDVIVFGSVSRGEGDSYVAEVGFYQNDGKPALTQAETVGSSGSWRVGRAMSELVSNVMSLYPFAGTLVASGEEGHKVGLGRNLFPLDGDDVFALQSAKRDEEGRVVGYADGGTLKMDRARDDYSLLREQKLSARAVPGDRVVRIDAAMRGASAAERATIAVRGSDGAPVAGANVYIDERWAGSTGSKGEVRVPLRPGREYKLLVYRHGYEQAVKSIEPAKGGERFEFALRSYSSLFTIESDPSGAAVSLDDGRIGSTPLDKGYPVTRGFHTVKVDAGGDYRTWEEVLEFSQKEESRTGANRVVLYKDFLRLAERAETARDFDGAIKLYGMAPKDHPDYAEIHSRLGQLYFDDKRDYDRAIAEFETVQAVPEVRELVYKQFSVLYTNLGKAYYAKGEKLYRANRNEALTLFAKAIKALDRARENTRFFPGERHDEAVHDTYYYRAMAYHNLYVATKREAIAREAENAWQEYFDFFPPALRGKPQFDQLRETGEKLAEQVQDH